MFEIIQDANDPDNGYAVEVAYTDSDPISGAYRIIPPFICGEAFLQGLSDDVGVELAHYVTTQEATVIEFHVDESKFINKTVCEKIIHTGEQLRKQLGLAANSRLFDKEFNGT
ncbi:MAG: hypothetical protein JWS12_662 [Candidatus Saccharibacteria bacterium]|nr:hypothetical protein [Candidatus Saccharibacteria bacterium]